MVVEATASPSTQNGRSLLHTTFARSFGTRPWAQTLAWTTYQAKSPLPMFNTATIGCDKGHLLGLPTSARLLAACSRALDCLSHTAVSSSSSPAHVCPRLDLLLHLHPCRYCGYFPPFSSPLVHAWIHLSRCGRTCLTSLPA